MKWIRVVVALTTALVCREAKAQSVDVGHLETKDDTGLNWLFLHCQRDGSVMDCDVFQTLFVHTLAPENRSEKIAKQMKGDKGDAVQEFIKSGGFGMCKDTAQMRNGLNQALKNGKQIDGKPISPKALKFIQNYLPVASSIEEACHNPNLDSIRHMFEVQADRDQVSCKLYNTYSHLTFKWNPQTESWVSREGPGGDCGLVTIGTLQHDKGELVSAFWTYTEHRVITNPGGQALAASCSQLSDRTLNYTWRMDQTVEDCKYIESGN
jgi:hypothetical protein